MKPKWMKWQEEFRSQPVVWATWYRIDGFEEIGDIYADNEGAQLEVDWCKRKGKRPPRIGSIHIHSLKLAKERWGPCS